jgi:hypothetical protein
MNRYSDYNIIPIGDHCAIPLIIKDLNLRKCSYPFDWVSNLDQLYNTNIISNISLIHELSITDDIEYIVKKYIGDAFENNKTNSITNNWFPHDTENIDIIYEKYKRRFIRLKSDLYKKNIFILLTRHYYIEKDIFEQIIKQLLNYNNDSIILFISGTNHEYFDNMNNKNVIFKYIEYDISQFYNYDYTTFRPNIKIFLENIFQTKV